MRRVRLLAFLLVVVVGTAQPAAGDVVTGTDPSGDASAGWTDVVDYWARYDAKRLDVYVRVREAVTVTRTNGRGTTTTDAVFPLGLSVLVWLSVDADDEPEAVVELANNGSGVVVASTYTGDASTPCATRTVGTTQPYRSGSVYWVPVDVGCLGGPAAVRYAIDVVQESTRPGTPGAGSADAAPEVTMTAPVARAATGEDGYWLLGRDGGVFSFGDAAFYGSTGAVRLNQPVVGMAAVPDGRGYWFVAADGGIFSFGSAPFFGSTGDIRLNQPIVALAPTPSGRGYWLVASDGGIFAFGDAAFHGSTGDIRLNRPIVGMAPTPTGKGYWLVANDGGIFTFGDAAFHGSGVIEADPPAAVSLLSTPTGQGYWIIRANGQVLSFGDAALSTSAYDKSPAAIVAGTTVTGEELRSVGADGKVYSMLAADDLGDLRGVPLSAPIIGMAATP